jgi:hypothetical protein
MKKGFTTSLLVFILALALAPAANAAVGAFAGSVTSGEKAWNSIGPVPIAVDSTTGDFYSAGLYGGTADTAGYKLEHYDQAGTLLDYGASGIPDNQDCSSGGNQSTRSQFLPTDLDFDPVSGSVLETNRPQFLSCVYRTHPAIYELSASGAYAGTYLDLTVAPSDLGPQPPTFCTQNHFLDSATNQRTGETAALWDSSDPCASSGTQDAEVQILDAAGTAISSFHLPSGQVTYSNLTVDPGTVLIPSSIYVNVTDLASGSTSVVHYEEDGTLIGTAGQLPSKYRDLSSLAYDPSHQLLYALVFDGNYYAGAHPVVVAWDASGNYLGAINGSGSSSGYFGETHTGSDQCCILPAIAVNQSTGRLYVTDPLHRAIDWFDPVAVPEATTGSATTVNPNSEYVVGAVNPSGLSLDSCSIQYGSTSSYGSSVPCSQSLQTIGSDGSDVQVSQTLTGLAAASPIHYRFVACNDNGCQAGFDNSFTTSSAVKPTIDSQSSGNLTSRSVTFQAQINPNFAATTYRFEYGVSTAYGQTTPSTSLGATDGSDHLATAATSGFLPGSTVHWRTVASNSAGQTLGQDQTFTTPAEAPQVIGVSSGGITTSSGTINAVINAEGAPTTCFVDFVSDSDYQPFAGNPYAAGSTVACSINPVGGNSNVSVSATENGFDPDTSYHGRVRLQNSVGSTSSSDILFVTDALPPVISNLSVSDVSSSSATLQAQLAPNSTSATYHFEYGTSTAYGLGSPVAVVTSDGVVSFQVTGLVANTVYHGRLVATNRGGTSTSSDVSFTTSDAPQQTPPAVAPEIFFYSGPPPESDEQQATFVFSGSASVTHFECAVDASSWIPCSSGFGTRVVPGDHKFQVRGLTDSGASSNVFTYWWTVDLPQSCIVKTARAHMLVSKQNQRLHLATKYTAYSPAKNVVGRFFAKLKGGKKLMLGSSSANFKTAGVFKIVKPVGAKVWKKVKKAKSFGVQLSVPHAQASCTQYLTKSLTVKKLVGSDPVWFQSDSLFTKSGPRL